ncbi:MAG: hypothetical protein EZS28_026741, partial [Streblomastix strix]
KRINEEEINIESIGETSDGSLAAFHLPEYELGVIYITSFAPDDISDFQSNFFDIVKQLSDTTGSFYSKKLLIDLRYNGGGYGRLAYILTRFLFPHVDSPIWEPMDLPKSNIGKIFTKITDFSIKQEQLQELQLDEATGEVIYDYYQQEGSQRTTKYTDDQGGKSSITVDLTKKATFYAGHVDELRQIASDWDLRRKTIWQPKDVTVLLEGSCISTCADFTKIIHQKRAARIVTIGNFGGVQDGDRYNAGTAGGSSIQNSDAVDETYQKFLDDPTFGSTVGFDESDFHEQFYRDETSLSYVDTKFYEITKDSKKHIIILGWNLDLKRMCLKMADKKTGATLQVKEIHQINRDCSPNQDKISSINNNQVEFLESPSGKSISVPQQTESAKIRSLKNKYQKKIMKLFNGILQELVTLELQTGDTLVQLGEWTREQRNWTSDKKQIEAIYLGLFHYGQVFKELHFKAILIRSDSSIKINGIAKQRDGETLAAEVKKIVMQCQQLILLTQIQHIPGISNEITDVQSRLFTQGDYSVKQEIFRTLWQVWQITPTLNLFAIELNKFVDRFVAIGEEEEGAEWLNAFSRPWKEEIVWIYPSTPKIGRAMIAQEKFKSKSIKIAPWQLGQIWFTHLLADFSRYLLLGKSSLIPNPGKQMTKWKNMLPPGKIAAFFINQ